MAADALKSLFQLGEYIAVPGVFDLVSAKLAKATYMTGYGLRVATCAVRWHHRLSGADRNLNAPTRADGESESHPRGKILTYFLFLIAGLGLATSCGTAFGNTMTLPREDNIWGGYAHQPTQSEVTQHEQSAGTAASSQEQQLDNDEIESIYARLMRETAPRSQ
jgi:hypothetical protein